MNLSLAQHILTGVRECEVIISQGPLADWATVRYYPGSPPVIMQIKLPWTVEASERRVLEEDVKREFYAGRLVDL